MSQNTLLWWPIIKHLRDYVRLQPEFNAVAVRAGTKKPKDPYPCVEILWDEESGISLFRPNKGDLTIWADLWIRSDDKDPEAAYDTLNSLQNRLCEVLVRWSDALLDDKGVTVNLTLQSAISDAETQRPLVGCRMAIKIDWRK